MKIRPVGAMLFYADGRTDTKKLVVTFRNLRTRQKMDKRIFWITKTPKM
jgi:hypothetical protein